MNIIATSYVPVLHKGYLSFFNEIAKQTDTFFVFDEEVMSTFDFHRKDIRALEAKDMITFIKNLNIFKKVETISLSQLEKITDEVLMADDEVSRGVAERCNIKDKTTFLPIFIMRHDSSKVAEPLPPEEKYYDEEILEPSFIQLESIKKAEEEAKLSSDWWRHVGGVLSNDKEILISAHNIHVPSEHMPYAYGDPRMFFKKGINIDIGTALHAEQSIIATSAKEGIKTEGLDLYTTTFPCPSCAKLIAYSGVKAVYFSEGYAMLDGYSILNSKGIKVYKISKQS